MQVFVYAPEDFTNLCVLTRTLDALGLNLCYVFDPHRIVRPRYGRSYTRKLKAISAGAFFRIEFVPVSAPLEFIAGYGGRTIATVPDQSATSLYDFTFGQDDLLVFGSEGGGLPPELIKACDFHLSIPQRGTTQSLNLCVASGIILAEWFRQMQPSVRVAETWSPTSGQARTQNERNH
jgi:tRNA (cytidine/uridine-2'-O-)-methyltransferase